MIAPQPANDEIKILLVDDQPNNLLALEAVLESLGHTLVRAGSGREALKRLLQEDFAVILLDAFMPDMDGFETAALIRQRERSRLTPIIFLTALGKDETNVFRGYSVGAVDYLFKPVVPEILRAKVSVFVDQFKKTQEIRRQADELRLLARREHEARLSEAKQRWEADRLRADLRIAREIQQKLYPKAAPAWSGVEIAGQSWPAEMAGGDYFDYLTMANDSLGVGIGDVSGHGVGPAILMAETRAYLRALSLVCADVGQILSQANQLLTGDTRSEQFVTLFLGRLDPAERRLHYASAGHLPGYVLDRSGEVKSVLESMDLPLGLIAGERHICTAETALDEGDTVLLITDGITEAMSPDGAMFGMQRAVDAVRICLNETAAQTVDFLCRTALQFAAQPLQRDDMTAIVLKIQPRAS
jgi:serine phosphatase RsbU (regulator of sigma subunit)